jgi:ATP-binding cassette subfamily F protein uup
MAAPILSYEDLGLIQGEGWLFRGLDLYIGERDRLALIGRNGAGKTTLLKCLAGLIDPDEGKRTIVPGTHVVLLEQDPKMDGFETLQTGCARPDAPEAHEAAAIADQLDIDLSRPTSTASGESDAARRLRGRLPKGLTCSCSTSRRTIWTLPRSSGLRSGSSDSPARSS